MNSLLQIAKAPLVVVERDGQWAAALRLALGERRLKPGDFGGATLLDVVRITELRSMDDLWPALREQPTGTIALEVTMANVKQFAKALLRLEREFSSAIAFAVAARGLAAYSGMIREAGAVCVTDSPRCLADVCELVALRIAKQADLRGASNNDADQIFSSLPWTELVNRENGMDHEGAKTRNKSK